MSAREDGAEALALPDLERRVANGVRLGTILAVDHAAARVRVKSGEIETAWLPWSTGRASNAKRRWDPPAVGEQVVVLSPGGDMRQGIVLPGVFSTASGAPASSADKDAIAYGDGTVVEYDRGSRTLLVNFGSASITATPSTITLAVGGVSLAVSASGVAIVGGSVTHNGTNIGDTHTHDGSPSAPPGPQSNTGAPT